MRHIILISGKDSAATAIVQKTRQPDLPYEFAFNEVGKELPPFMDWLDRMEAYLCEPLHRIKANLRDIIYEQGILPGHNSRFCTRMAKIMPIERFVGKTEACVYYGLRYDEPQREGYNTRKNGTQIIPQYPLRDMRLGLPEVYAILRNLNLLPPTWFWASVYAEVVSRVGTEILEQLQPWQFDELFAWRSRNNCYDCFYLRQYEVIGLYEHFPEIFWRGVEDEEAVGADDYTLIKGHSLRSLATRADEIREKRIRKIVNILKRVETGEASLQDTVSCGLLCGK